MLGSRLVPKPDWQLALILSVQLAGGQVQLKEIIQSLTSRSLQLYNDGENHRSPGMSNFRDTFKMKLSSQASKTTSLYLRQKRQSGINFFFFFVIGQIQFASLTVD